jgi:hypothetical protein
VEVLDADGATVIDLCAWPLGRPHEFATAIGRGDVLGANQIVNPATYFGGHPLAVHKTPEAWLRAGSAGCAPLNSTGAARIIGEAPGAISADDDAHARDLARLLHPFFNLAHIFVPFQKRAA